jgi:H+/Cl- antiporter ClcA
VVNAWLTRRFFPAAEGSGIPQAIAMVKVPNEARRHEVLGLGTGLFKGLMIMLGIACGASIGREGPTVHIATAISYSLSHIGRFRHYVRRRRLILAGAAAGLSAAFNTPLAVVALLTMAAYFAGVMQSPMTSVLIIMEMTDEQHLLLPLMATVLLAQWVSRHVCPRPIYLALAEDFLKQEKKRDSQSDLPP